MHLALDFNSGWHSAWLTPPGLAASPAPGFTTSPSPDAAWTCLQIHFLCPLLKLELLRVLSFLYTFPWEYHLFHGFSEQSICWTLWNLPASPIHISLRPRNLTACWTLHLYVSKPLHIVTAFCVSRWHPLPQIEARSQKISILPISSYCFWVLLILTESFSISAHLSPFLLWLWNPSLITSRAT